MFFGEFQAVCDPIICFTIIVCRWSGVTQGNRIFDKSAICAMFENNEIEAILFGDGGYLCRYYMMTLFYNPRNNKERNCNKTYIT